MEIWVRTVYNCSGDTSILVSHTTHGFTVGEYVQFANGDNVGGLNLEQHFKLRRSK